MQISLSASVASLGISGRFLRLKVQEKQSGTLLKMDSSSRHTFAKDQAVSHSFPSVTRDIPAMSSATHV